MLHLLRFNSKNWCDNFKSERQESEIASLIARGINVSTGRQAVYHLCQLLNLKEGDTCLLPAYIAEGVLLPLKSLKLNIAFYRLDKHLNPDQDSIEEIIHKYPDAKLIFIIHFFGKSTQIDEEKIRRKSPSIKIVDDYALSLYAGLSSYAGRKNGFSLFSYNKFFPCLDGATLVASNKTSATQVFKESRHNLFRLSQEHLLMNAEAFHSSDVNKSINDISSSYEAYYKEINRCYEPTSMSAASIDFLTHINIDKVSLFRRRNTKQFYDQLDPQKYGCYYKREDLGACPFAVPIFSKASSRDNVIKTCLDNNILLSTLEEKWNFIPEGQETEFPNEAQFIKSHLLIPISETLDERDIGHIVNTLNNV